jgi:hypothetical protein
MTARYEPPVLVRWTGPERPGVRADIERAVRAGVRRALDRYAVPTGPGMGSRAWPAQPGPGPELFLLPSYDDEGRPVAVPVRESDEERVRRRILAMIRLPAGTRQPGVYPGVYLAAESDRPKLYFLRHHGEQEIIDSLLLYLRLGDQTGPLALAPGFYTVVFRPQSGGTLTRQGRVVHEHMENPGNLDLTIAFTVDPGRAAHRDPPPWTFVPVLHIAAGNQETPVATEAESVYYAVTDIWRVDENWQPREISPLAFVGTFPHYRWTIHQLPGEKDAGWAPKLVFEESGHRAYALRYRWREPGRYQITATVTVRGAGISPGPVTSIRTEQVIDRLLKVQLRLTAWQRAQRDKGEPIWATSAQALVQRYERELADARTAGNEAKVDYLTEVLDDLREQLDPGEHMTTGPFPVHAVFMDRKSSRIRPVSLFLAFHHQPASLVPYHWSLTDVTTPAFYRTYEGFGRTVIEALLATFSDSETSLRRTYPPGWIHVRITAEELTRNGITGLTGFTRREFVFETDSWQKDAYDWVSLGVQAAGVAALVAAVVLPPAALLGKALLVVGLAGAALSVVNILARLDDGSLRWDLETFADIAGIVAAIAQVGALVAGSRATALARALDSAENVPEQLLTRLRLAATVQRTMLVTQLGTDVADGVLVAYGTYQQLRLVDAEFDDASLREYQRVHGDDEGRRRWEQERRSRITGIFADAVVSGTFIAISVRSGLDELGTMRRPPAAPPAHPKQQGPEATAGPGELLPTDVDRPLKQWPSHDQLVADARTDPDAGHTLRWYESRTTDHLRALEALGDPVAAALLNRAYGGKHRPLLRDRPSDPAVQEKLVRELRGYRAEVEARRRELQADGEWPAGEAPATKKGQAGTDWVSSTAKERAGYAGTIGVAVSDIPTLQGQVLQGGSPRALGTYNPEHPIRPGEKVTVTKAQGHAEQSIAQQIHDRLAAMSPQQRSEASGGTVWIRVDQAVCSTCSAGVGTAASGGVLVRASELNPDIVFVVTADDDPARVIRLRAGRKLP